MENKVIEFLVTKKEYLDFYGFKKLIYKCDICPKKRPYIFFKWKKESVPFNKALIAGVCLSCFNKHYCVKLKNKETK